MGTVLPDVNLLNKMISQLHQLTMFGDVAGHILALLFTSHTYQKSVILHTTTKTWTLLLPTIMDTYTREIKMLIN